MPASQRNATAMIDATLLPFDLPAVARKKLTVDFDGGNQSSDGGLLGTAEYMAPEQAEGRPVTPSCDLYSLGGVLYAWLAGRPPFRGKTLPEMLHMQRFSTPENVRLHAPQTPEEFANIVMRLLEKEPQPC